MGGGDGQAEVRLGPLARELQDTPALCPGALLRRLCGARGFRPRAASSCWASTDFDSKPRAIPYVPVCRTTVPNASAGTYNRKIHVSPRRHVLVPFGRPGVGIVAACVLAAACALAAACRRSEPASANSAQPEPSPPPSRTEDTRPKIVFLGDSLTAGLGLRRHTVVPRAAAGEDERRRLHVRSRQRRRIGRHIGGRPPPARLVAPGRRPHTRRRARRERRASRPVRAGHEAEPRADHRGRPRRRASSCSSRAWKRRRTTAPSTPHRSGRRIASSR